MGQNPNFRGGQNRKSRGGQNGSRGGQIQKFFGATRRSKTALQAGDFAPPLEKILATPLERTFLHRNFKTWVFKTN